MPDRCLKYTVKIMEDQLVTKVREASWEAFAAIRQRAREDVFFAGCEAQKHMQEIVTLPLFAASLKDLLHSDPAAPRVSSLVACSA